MDLKQVRSKLAQRWLDCCGGGDEERTDEQCFHQHARFLSRFFFSLIHVKKGSE
jgi:hypothetical protein